MRQHNNHRSRHAVGHRQALRISALLVIFLLAGCSPISRHIEYQNKETGIWFEMPGNWTAKYSDRNATVYISGRRASAPSATAHITISAGHCSNEHAPIDTELEALSEMAREDIDRIGRLYGLETVEIVEEPARVEGTYFEGVLAIIQVPTSAMGKGSEGSKETPAGDPSPDTFQIIEIYAANYNQNIIWIHFYPGNDDQINAQAREIIRSVRRVCDPEGE